MSHTTPLPDVARLLGAETAKLVDKHEPEIQILVLIAVRAYVVHLESYGVLDPITFQEEVHKFVDAFLMAYKGERRA